MTIQYHEMSRRTKILILILSLFINCTFLILILNSQRAALMPLQARVIKLDEEEIIAPSQFMQPMNSPAQAAAHAASAQQQTQTPPPAQPQQQTPPLPQQDFEWVSGAAGMGKPGSPATPKTPEIPKMPLQDAHEDVTEPDENSTNEIEISDEQESPETQDPDVTNDYAFPAGSSYIYESQAEMSKKQELRASSSQKASKPSRQLPSLAELTRGFIDRTATDDQVGTGGGGMHTIGVTGGKTGVVSEKQLTYERYLRKILVCVSTSSKIHKSSIPRTTQKSQARVQLMLNRDGSYYMLELAQSSGNPAIDALILEIFSDASSSFPPVPQSLSVPFAAPQFVLNSIYDLLRPEAWAVSVNG